MKQLPATLDANFAMQRYFKDPDCMFKTGIGGVLTTTGFLVGLLDLQRLIFVPVALALSAIVVGYLLRTAKAKLKDPEAGLQPWNDWGDLFFSGLNWVAVQFGLGILAAMPITSILLVASFALASSTNVSTVSLVVAFGGFAIFWLVLVSHYMISYLMINFASEDKVLAGFAFGKVIRYTAKAPRDFILAWILSFELQFLALLLPTLTLVGVFVAPYTLFAAQLIGLSLMTQAWRSVEDAEKFTAQPLS